MATAMREAKIPQDPAAPSERSVRRSEYAAAVGDETGIDEALIALQVRRFYAAARRDPLLGPVFVGVTDWEAHLTRIMEFWSSVALMAGRYHGNPLAAHRPLPISEAHFARWLALWSETAAATCPPQAAARFASLAERIAASLSRALASRRRNVSPPAPKEPFDDANNRPQ
jgi:hemoglobin